MGFLAFEGKSAIGSPGPPLKPHGGNDAAKNRLGVLTPAISIPYEPIFHEGEKGKEDDAQNPDEEEIFHGGLARAAHGALRARIFGGWGYRPGDVSQMLLEFQKVAKDSDAIASGRPPMI